MSKQPKVRWNIPSWTRKEKSKTNEPRPTSADPRSTGSSEPSSSKGSTVPERRLQRQVKYTSAYFFSIAGFIWSIATVTCALDWLMILIPQAYLLRLLALVPALEFILLVSASLTLLFFFFEIVEAAVFGVDGLRKKITSLVEHYPGLLLGGAVVLVLLEVILKFGRLDLVSLIIAGVVALAAVRGLREALKQQAERQNKLESDYAAWIERRNLQIFLVQVIPVIAARVACFCATVTALLAGQAWIAAGVPLMALLILWMMHPEGDSFMTNCRRCGIRTSRALAHEAMCPICTENDKKREQWRIEGSVSKYR